MIVYKYVIQKENGELVSNIDNEFKYNIGKIISCDIKNNYSGIYCFYKNGIKGVSSRTKKDFILLELEAREKDLLRQESDRVIVFKSVKPLRIVNINEYEKWNNCNECEFINITEEEQINKKLDHICLKYNTRVIHKNNNPKIQHNYIYPCQQCEGKDFK